MTTLPVTRYRFLHKLQPISLLTQLTSKPITGCLQVFTIENSWTIYFDEGKIIYASQYSKMFELLYQKLQHFSQHIPTLNSNTIQQLRAIFEHGIKNQAIANPDYLAICWLVNQKHLNPAQGKILVEQLSVEILDTFLSIQEGSYEFNTNSFLDDLPKFCHLDVNLLISQHQKRSRWERQKQTVFPQMQLPQFFQQQSQKEVQNNTSPKTTAVNPDKKIYTVLCIDDSPTILNTIKSYLDEQMFNMVGIDDSLKALMYIVRIKPNLILLDINMPKLDGYELCSLIRKHSYLKNIPVIMVSSRAGLINKAKARMVGASGYLTKPFTQAELLKTIFQHIA